MNHLLRSIVFMATTFCVAAPTWADNDDDNATENIARVVPYDGVLDLDGAGYNGLVDVIFTLYDASSGGDVVWTETWSAADGRAINITGGRFTVNLGAYESIEAAIADGGQLYLGMQIKLPEANAYTALRGRQRLNPVPYALWSAQASNLAVGGDARVGGDLNVDGNTNAGRLNLQTLWVDQGNDNPARALEFLNNHLYLGRDGAFGDGLRVAVPGRFERTLRVDGNTTLVGDLNVNRTISIGGSYNMNDGAGVTAALSMSGGYLRLGTSGRFGSGVIVPTDFRTQRNADIDGSLNVDSNVTVGGSLNLTGSLNTTQKLVHVQLFDMNIRGDLDTEIDSRVWFCVIGSMDLTSGRIATGEGNPLRAYTRSLQNTWRIFVDIRSQDGHEEFRRVGLVCFRKTVVNDAGWF
ncbi:MAG: hypothetical protein ACE366_00910 [Bradymonadia bacterium]